MLASCAVGMSWIQQRSCRAAGIPVGVMVSKNITIPEPSVDPHRTGALMIKGGVDDQHRVAARRDAVGGRGILPHGGKCQVRFARDHHLVMRVIQDEARIMGHNVGWDGGSAVFR